jgi:hypothetical protein
MPKAIMIVYTDPVEPAREEEYRAWYDHHIGEALRAVQGMPRATRYRLTPQQRHAGDAPAGFMTIYEIDADDVDAVHEQLLAASENGELSESDVIRPGPVVYWDVDSEITRD